MSSLPGPASAGYETMPVARPFDASRAACAASLAVAAGTVLLGLLAGYLWSLLAPRAQLVMLGPGAPGLVQAETSAFIVADATFSGIVLAGGVVSGGLGYLLAVRRYGPLAMAGVAAGAAGAAFAARWVGEQSGLATFHHLVAALPAGARLTDHLTLGAGGALVFWPLAACLVAGGLEAFVTRSRRAHRQPAPPA
jgi:hypothetical protein